MSNFDALSLIPDHQRPFYHIKQLVVCPTGDGSAIEGFQFGIAAYERADAASTYEMNGVDTSKLRDIQLPIIGMERG